MRLAARQRFKSNSNFESRTRPSPFEAMLFFSWHLFFLGDLPVLPLCSLLLILLFLSEGKNAEITW
jgi:hypothetical protein